MTDAPRRPGDDHGHGEKLRGRFAVYVLLAALGVAAMTDSEWWPVSSLRLFSETRGGTSESWEVALVDEAGTEHPIVVADLGRSFRGAHHLIPRFDSMDGAGRDEVCSAWAVAAAEAGAPAATEVRIYRVVREVPTEAGGDRTEVGRRLRWTCAGTER